MPGGEGVQVEGVGGVGGSAAALCTRGKQRVIAVARGTSPVHRWIDAFMVHWSIAALVLTA